MAQYNITRLQADLAGILHGTTINQITNPFGLYNRAASQLLLDLDANETIRNVPFASVIYNSVWDYPIPDDVKGNNIIDIIPQVHRGPWSIWTQSYLQAFDVWKTRARKNGFTIAWNQGVKTIRIDAPYLPTPVLLNSANSIGANGTWITGGDATNLTENNTNFISTGSSLQFDLDGSTGTGYLENSTSGSINLSDVINQATEFLYTYLPQAIAPNTTNFQSVEFWFGSSPTDYYSVTATLNQQANTFIAGWNLIGFPWLGAGITGTPDPANITYLRVTWNYTAGDPQTAVLLNNITSNLGQILNIEYYSKYMFADSITGAFQEQVTSVNNLINLDTDSYMLYFNLVAAMGLQQQQGLDAAFYDGNFFGQAYLKGLAAYKARYPSQTQKAQTVYYRPIRGGNYYGRQGGPWRY